MHQPSRRAIAAISGTLAIAGLAAVPSRAAEGFSLSRVAGVDRYATAANAALDEFSSSTSVVIARGDSFADALAGSYLTGSLGAPVLLTTPGELPAVTDDALAALGATTVYLLGGTGAISAAVADDAGKGREVVRVAGADRYATAARIATGQDATGIGEVAGDRTAIVVSGESFADALAAAPMAHAEQLPVLLTRSSSLAPEAGDAIDMLGIEHVVVVGGTAAVSDAVLDALASHGVTTERVAGVNRYATAAAVADFALETFAGFVDTEVGLATGEGFADALAAGPVAGASHEPILLTASTSLSAEARSWLEEHAGSLVGGRVFGGTAAMADAVVDAAEAAGSGAAAGAQEGQLTFIDKAADTYRLVADGAGVSSTVTYAGGDSFAVDGVTATVGGFEAAASPADRVRHVPAAGNTPARHELANVAATGITSGSIGNVDIANTQLDFINEVNGDSLRADVAWSGVTWSVDGATVNQAGFESALNEGDTLEITTSGSTTQFALTNETADGTVSAIVPGMPPVPPATQLQVGALGDDPANNTNDSHFQADGGPTGTDTFSIDGVDGRTYDAFVADLTAGDAIAHSRAGGIEHYALINRSPGPVVGGAVDDLDPASGPLPTQTGGGSFTVVTDAGPVGVTYDASGTFVVDGRVAGETELEAAYTAGDAVSFRSADAPSGTPQRVELTNETLAGPVGKDTITTADTVLPTDGGTANSYGVLGQDGATVLKQVVYVSANASSDTYFLTGASVTLARFEQELDAIKAGTRTGTMVVQITGTGDATVTEHRLTSATA